jgi:hypothetical protein
MVDVGAVEVTITVDKIVVVDEIIPEQVRNRYKEYFEWYPWTTLT